MIDDLTEHVQTLTNCLTELKAEVAEKDKRIDDLEQRVDPLEAEQTTHEKRMDALGMGIESANDDIADLEDNIDATSSCTDEQSTPAVHGAENSNQSPQKGTLQRNPARTEQPLFAHQLRQ